MSSLLPIKLSQNENEQKDRNEKRNSEKIFLAEVHVQQKIYLLWNIWIKLKLNLKHFSSRAVEITL